MKIHPLITTSDALADLCARLAKAEFVTVDTDHAEHIRPELKPSGDRRWPRSRAIDPLAPGIDLTPLLELMTANEDVLKVFHAGGQDVEIIFNLTGRTPHPDLRYADRDDGGQPVGTDRLFEPRRKPAGLAIDKYARALPIHRAAR